MTRILLFSLCLLGLASCKKKEIDPAEIEFGYEYFPLKEGRYMHYLVDSIGHDITSDTSSYQIKEVIGESFTDIAGHPAFEVKRYKRMANGDPWSLVGVWTQKRTPTTAERVEDNVRFVRLIFPINESASWNGNAHNTLGNWTHTYSNIGAEVEVGPFTFENTVQVNQRNNVNLVDQELAYEIYCSGIGMIYKKFIDLNFQEDGMFGIELEMRLIDFGNQ
jgi:hypothetical protein